MNNEKKNALDWLRMIACMGVIAQHVRFNIPYDSPSNIFNRVIISFDDFVFLFMAISSFGLCYGYYNKVFNGSINWETFYKRRFAKILPFFLTMILLDLCIDFSFDSLMQAFVEAIMFHGFIPVEFTVIGVGWFIGVVFIFYLIFPFFCVLLKNKKTGWTAFIIAIGLHLISEYHFKLTQSNFAFSFCFFFIGGIIYLYKDRIDSFQWRHTLLFLILSVALYFLNTNIITRVLLLASILAFAVSLDIRAIKPVSFISSISMEIYLCHMLIFRVFERTSLYKALGGGIVQYLITYIVVFIGASVMSVIVKFILEKLSVFIKKCYAF